MLRSDFWILLCSLSSLPPPGCCAVLMPVICPWGSTAPLASTGPTSPHQTQHRECFGWANVPHQSVHSRPHWPVPSPTSHARVHREPCSGVCQGLGEEGAWTGLMLPLEQCWNQQEEGDNHRTNRLINWGECPSLKLAIGNFAGRILFWPRVPAWEVQFFSIGRNALSPSVWGQVRCSCQEDKDSQAYL